MSRLFIISAIIVVLAIAATFVSVKLGSSGDPYEFDIVAECAKFAANPKTDDAEVLAFLTEQRKEYERLGNTEIVAEIDEHLDGWEARQDEHQARLWSQYEEACLPEPKPQTRRMLTH